MWFVGCLKVFNSFLWRLVCTVDLYLDITFIIWYSFCFALLYFFLKFARTFWWLFRLIVVCVFVFVGGGLSVPPWCPSLCGRPPQSVLSLVSVLILAVSLPSSLCPPVTPRDPLLVLPIVQLPSYSLAFLFFLLFFLFPFLFLVAIPWFFLSSNFVYNKWPNLIIIKNSILLRET